MQEIHLTLKDFKIDWYSGTGAGGQHRNKHQNCCRITHIESGLTSVGADNRERAANRRDAFNRLSKKVIPLLSQKETKIVNTSVIRNYNKSKNMVHDKASGLKQPYKQVVNDIGPMIEARHSAMIFDRANSQALT